MLIATLLHQILTGCSPEWAALVALRNLANEQRIRIELRRPIDAISEKLDDPERPLTI